MGAEFEDFGMTRARKTIRRAALRFDAVHGRGAAAREARAMIILIPAGLIIAVGLGAITGGA